MIRRLVRRYGYFAVTLCMTLSSMALATLLLVGFDLVFKGHVPAVDLLIVNLIAGISAPVMTNRFIRLIHQLDSAEEQLKTLARQDLLTGIYNRRHFLELARRDWDRFGHCPSGRRSSPELDRSRHADVPSRRDHGQRRCL